MTKSEVDQKFAGYGIPVLASADCVAHIGEWGHREPGTLEIPGSLHLVTIRQGSPAEYLELVCFPRSRPESPFVTVPDYLAESVTTAEGEGLAGLEVAFRVPDGRPGHAAIDVLKVVTFVCSLSFAETVQKAFIPRAPTS